VRSSVSQADVREGGDAGSGIAVDAGGRARGPSACCV
jgi:hypothetical protein